MEPKRVQPSEAGNAAEFVELMRQLKEQSGCSLRQLMERADSQGDVLARSTIADILRREALPRVEPLAAFVRACGAEDQLPDWLRVRERLAAEPHLAPSATLPANDPLPFGDSLQSDGEDNSRGSSRTGRWVAVTTTLGVLAALAAAVVLLVTLRAGTPNADAPSTQNTPAPDVFPVPSAGGWATIHPARSRELCLTEGRDRGGRYRSAIAVQRPCAETVGPRTFLKPIDPYTTHIEWEHPVDKAMGCLTILDHGPAKDLLEPQPECSADRNSQILRIERIDPGGDTYRLRRAGTDLCVVIADDAIGAEARQEPCRAEDHQYFRVELTTSMPPSGPPLR